METKVWSSVKRVRGCVVVVVVDDIMVDLLLAASGAGLEIGARSMLD